jgi:hypothetical protein
MPPGKKRGIKGLPHPVDAAALMSQRFHRWSPENQQIWEHL